MAVEGIHGVEGRGGVGAHVPQECADVGPVLLLDMGVIVFLVGALASELDPLSLAIPVEMVVDELRAVVGVNALKGKGQGLPDLLKGVSHAGLPFAHHGPPEVVNDCESAP